MTNATITTAIKDHNEGNTADAEFIALGIYEKNVEKMGKENTKTAIYTLFAKNGLENTGDFGAFLNILG